MLTTELVRRGARRHGTRTAVISGEQKLTFREVDETANRMANVLIGLGVQRGTRIGLLVDNGLWSVPIDFACLKAGAVRVPLNARLSADEQARMLEATGVRTLVHGTALADRAAELASRIAGLRLVSLGPSTEIETLDLLDEMSQASAADPYLPAEPDDPVLILYTSGTTGALKAVVHTQVSYAAICANVLANMVSPGPDSVMLHAASLIHASGTFVLPYWVRGGAAAVLPGFDPASYLDSLARHRATEINLVPTMLGMLLSSGAAERADVSSLRTAVYGASPMPRPVLEQTLDLWGPRLVQYYGQTEAPLAITVLDAADHTDPTLAGSCGQPSVDAEVRVTAEDGTPLPAGEVGELRLRAPFAMSGYHDAPELTAETLDADGWVRTRDLARFDDRGYLTLVDQTSDMIITGGYNVYPREVEDVLMAHPAVAGAAVVGAPDPTWVEAVTAFVTLRPGVEITGAELQDAVRSALAGYKVPKSVHVVDSLPLSPVGKVLRRALREPPVGRRGTPVMTAAVIVERDGPVTTVRLSRPHARNAVDGETASALADAFRAFDADPDASVAVLHGEGGTFCAGADLRAVGTPAGNRTEPGGDGPMGPTRMRLTKPVIAAIAGYAVAGGLELALWCDLRVADETAVFGVYCRRWGVPLIDGGTVRLPRLIGTSRAMDLVLTGRSVDAVEALHIGLVNRVVAPGGALAAAQELAAQLAAFPQTCLREDRASLLEQDGLDEPAAMANEFAHGRTSLAVDALPGAARFAAGEGRHGRGI